MIIKYKQAKPFCIFCRKRLTSEEQELYTDACEDCTELDKTEEDEITASLHYLEVSDDEDDSGSNYYS